MWSLCSRSLGFGSFYSLILKNGCVKAEKKWPHISNSDHINRLF